MAELATRVQMRCPGCGRHWLLQHRKPCPHCGADMVLEENKVNDVAVDPECVWHWRGFRGPE